jgi:hypothetical protein
VASITGHKTLIMLKRYTHLRAAKIARKLGWVAGAAVHFHRGPRPSPVFTVDLPASNGPPRRVAYDGNANTAEFDLMRAFLLLSSACPSHAIEW